MENKMEYHLSNENIIVSFYGELDCNHVVKYRNLLVSILTKSNQNVIFDFQHTSFIDSSGIGLVLGRYQQLKTDSRKLVLCNLSPTSYKVFELSGLFELMDYNEEVRI